jgi:hypothetical protein
MPEDPFFRAAVAYAFNHRCMVALIREHDAVGQVRGECGERGHIGDISGSEEQRSRLAVELSQLAFQQHVPVAGPGDVARAAGACAAACHRLAHGGEHDGMLAHAEIVVGAPDGDAPQPGAVSPGCTRIGASMALKVREHPVASLGLDAS